MKRKGKMKWLSYLWHNGVTVVTISMLRKACLHISIFIFTFLRSSSRCLTLTDKRSTWTIRGCLARTVWEIQGENWISQPPSKSPIIVGSYNIAVVSSSLGFRNHGSALGCHSNSATLAVRSTIVRSSSFVELVYGRYVASGMCVCVDDRWSCDASDVNGLPLVGCS
jgi:hypothetical protein